MPNPALFKTIYRIATGTIFAALVIALLLALWKSSPPNIPTDPSAAARAEQKFAAADQAKASGQTPQVQLDRTELNSYLSQNLQVQGSQPDPQSNAPSLSLPVKPAAPNADDSQTGVSADAPTLEEVQSSVKDVKVDMDGDLVKAYVVFDFHGKDMSLELDGHIGAQDGYLKFNPVAGKLGSIPLPQSMLQSVVDKMMASPENREKLRLPSDINDIQIQNGQAVVSYK